MNYNRFAFLLMVLLSFAFAPARAQRVVAKYPTSIYGLESANIVTQGDSLLYLVPLNPYNYIIEDSRWIDIHGNESVIDFPRKLVPMVLTSARIGNTQYYYIVQKNEMDFVLLCVANEVGNKVISGKGTIALEGKPLAAFRDGADLLLVLAKKRELRLVVRRIRGAQVVDEKSFPLPFDPARRKSDYVSFYDTNEVRSVDDIPGTIQLVREGQFITLVMDEPLPPQPTEGALARTLIARINLTDNSIVIHSLFAKAMGEFMSTVSDGQLYRFIPERDLLEVFSLEDGSIRDNYTFERKASVPGYFESSRQEGKATISYKERAEPFNHGVDYILVDALDSGRAVLAFVHVGGVDANFLKGMALSMVTSGAGGMPVYTTRPVGKAKPFYNTTRAVLLGNGNYKPVGDFNTASGKMDLYEVGLGPKMKFKAKRYVKSATGFYGFFLPNKSDTVQMVHVTR